VTGSVNANPPGCKTQLYERHVLSDSGINLIRQQTIAVERFAVLDFHRFLPNARLQSRGWTLYRRSQLFSPTSRDCIEAGLCAWEAEASAGTLDPAEAFDQPLLERPGYSTTRIRA
jgi:hypothetical protein